MADDKKPNKPQKAPPPLPGPGRLPARAPGKVPQLPKPPIPGAGPSIRKPGAGVPRHDVQQQGSAPSSGEVEDMRRQLETQMMELQRQLQEEREKVLLQTVRAKEEEALASKVEESLKDIQDRLRREKREQELQEALSKNEGHVKELEQRLTAERQTWVETLKTQLGQRESQERELEFNFELKLKELERRWHEEKLHWSQSVKAKDEELIRLKRETEKNAEKDRQDFETRIKYLVNERDSLRRELKDSNDIRQEEKNNFVSKLETRDRDYLAIKAQQAMLVTQVKQGRERVDQLRQVLEKMRAEKNTLLSKIESKDKEFFLIKTQFALYQTRAKSEQERLLKEMVLFRENARKEHQRQDITIKSREDELNLLRKTSETRFLELKQEIEKKELEVASVIKQYEERMRNHSSELKHLWDKKEAEYLTQIKQVDEKLKVKEQEYIKLVAGKDELLKNEQIKLMEKLKAKDDEMSLQLSKERDMRVEMARYEERLRELEDKLRVQAQEIGFERDSLKKRENEVNQLIVQKDNEFKSEKLVLNEKLKSKDDDLQKYISRERDMQVSIAKDQERIRELHEKIDAQAKELTVEREKISKREQELSQLISQKEAEFRTAQTGWSERLKSTEDEVKKYIEKDHEMRLKMAKAEDRIHEGEEKARSLIHEIEQTKEYSAKTENGLRNAVNQKELELKNERSQADKNLEIKQEEIARLTTNENEMKVKAAKDEQRISELEEKNQLLEKDLLSEKGRIGIKEKEVYSLSRQFELEREALMGQFSKERTRFLVQIKSLQDEKQNLLMIRENQLRELKQKHQEELKAFEMSRKDHHSEKLLLEKEIEYRKRELDKARNEITIKERNIESDFRQKEMLYKNELAGLQAKLAESDRRYNDYRQRLNQSMAENRTLDDKIKEAARELDNVKRDTEQQAKEKKQFEESARAELNSIEQKYQKQRDELQNLIHLRERELSHIRMDRKKLEAELHNLKLEASNVISRLDKEKQERMKGVAYEIDALRQSMKAELKSLEQESENEQLELENELEKKQKQLSELNAKYEDIKRKLETEHAHREQMLAKLDEETEYKITEEREKWEAEKAGIATQIEALQIEKAKLQDKLEKMAILNDELEQKVAEERQKAEAVISSKLETPAKQFEDVNVSEDSTLVIPPPFADKSQQQAEASKVEASKVEPQQEAKEKIEDAEALKQLEQLESKPMPKKRNIFVEMIVKIWENLNEPVIEIKK